MWQDAQLREERRGGPEEGDVMPKVVGRRCLGTVVAVPKTVGNIDGVCLLNVVGAKRRDDELPKEHGMCDGPVRVPAERGGGGQGSRHRGCERCPAPSGRGCVGMLQARRCNRGQASVAEVVDAA